MGFPSSRMALPETCKQVVLVAPIDTLAATSACALATSPFVPLNADVLVCGVPAPLSNAFRVMPISSGGSGVGDSAASFEAAAELFKDTVRQIGVAMQQSRAPRPAASVTHMTQFFYGGVSPKTEEVEPMLRRIRLVDSASTAALVSASAYVLMLTASSLGDDATAGLTPYEALLRRLWAPAMGSVDPAAKRERGSLIVLADDTYRPAICALLAQLASETPTHVDWTVLLAYTHAMDPPALEYGAATVAVQAASGLVLGGALPALCAGNALGVLRHFPVRRSEPAAITPVDIALNAALLGHIWFSHDALPTCVECAAELQHRPAAADAATSSTQHRIAAFAVAESSKPGETSLVWGMVGEYLMGYYGRYAAAITAVFPVPGVLAAAPVLQFPFNAADVANFGPEPRAAAYPLEGWRARQQRQRIADGRLLADLPGSSVAAQALQTAVATLDGAVRRVGRVARSPPVQPRRTSRPSAPSSFTVAPYRLPDFDTSLYYALLRRLTSHYALMPYYQCVALAEVDWEAYVSVVARAALEHLARCVAPPVSAALPLVNVSIASIAGVAGAKPAPRVEPDSAPAPADAAVVRAFPEPRRYYTNDIIYHGPDRIPPMPSLTRAYLGYLVFVHRAGMAPNGLRGDMTPGMTPHVMTAILAQPDVRRLMTALAAKDGASRAEVEAQARRILVRCGDTLNHVQCRSAGLAIREFFRCIFDRVNVNAGAHERVHRYLAMPRVALVFVPLHRSYIDFLILSEVLALMHAPLPHIVAGDTFLSMGVVATLMRGSGAFFMRRSFRGDPLYAALFKEYVCHLVRGRRPVEFFIEGTRSRTGKTMAPKMGLLKFICDSFYERGQQELDDVLIMPVSLSYDELLEATMYAQELLGVPKPKETLSNMLKARSLLERMHGSINIHMGEPVSLRALRERPRQCPLPFQPRCEPAPVEMATPVPPTEPPAAPAVFDTTPSVAKNAVAVTPAPLLTTVAWHIMYQLQRNTVITPAALVAALVECLGPYYGTSAAVEGAAAKAGVPLATVHDGVEWLRRLLQERGAQLTAEAAGWAADQVVTRALGNLHRYLRLSPDGSTVVYQPDTVVARIGVNISTNQLIHACIDEAVVAVVTRAFGSPAASAGAAGAVHVAGMPCGGVRAVKTDVLSNQTQLLQRLLSVEFPNYAAAAPWSFTSWLECTVSRLQQQSSATAALCAAGPQLTAGAGAVVHVPVTPYYYFLLQLIGPHVEALYVVLVAASSLLAAYPGSPLGAALVVTATQRAATSLYAEHVLRYVVAANKETLQHYYECLISLSLLCLTRLPPPASGKTSIGAPAYEVGAVGAETALSRLEVLAAQMQALWWHPAAPHGAMLDRVAVQHRVLAAYRELTQPSKM